MRRMKQRMIIHRRQASPKKIVRPVPVHRHRHLQALVVQVNPKVHQRPAKAVRQALRLRVVRRVRLLLLQQAVRLQVRQVQAQQAQQVHLVHLVHLVQVAQLLLPLVLLVHQALLALHQQQVQLLLHPLHLLQQPQQLQLRVLNLLLLTAL